MSDQVIEHPPELQAQKEQLRLPPDYAVILLNDDFTPMEFVVQVLRGVFHHSEEQSIALMMEVHQRGKAIVGQYRKDIAETKQFQVLEYASHFQHPLKCEIQALPS